MSHAIRLRMSPSNVPDDAKDRIQTVKDTFRPVLDDADVENVEDTFEYFPGSPPEDIPEHYFAVLRFDDRDDRDAIVDELSENQFPGVKWYVVHVHSCVTEYKYDKYSGDADHPDGDVGMCDGWQKVRERGSVPDQFL